MQITPLSIEGAWRVEPRLFTDDRGTFLEWFKADAFEQAVGHRLDLAQSNVDIRVGSPTFGRYELVPLDDVSRHGLYVSEGLGHGYMALSEGAVFLYLCSAPYAPGREHGVTPLDPAIGIAWPTADAAGSPVTLAQAADQGLLPTYDEALAFRRSLARS